jgi:hypothetical protein
MIKQIDNNNNIHRKRRRKKNTYPLFAGVIYLAVDDFSIGNEEDISIIESSYCSPSSLCFSTKKKKKLLKKTKKKFK